MGQNGLASGGLVGEGEGDLGLLYQLHLTVGDDHGSLSLRAGFINAVLNGDAQRHTGGGSKEVGIDGAQHVVAQALGIADRQIDGAGPVGGAGCLEEDGSTSRLSGESSREKLSTRPAAEWLVMVLE